MVMVGSIGIEGINGASAESSVFKIETKKNEKKK